MALIVDTLDRLAAPLSLLIFCLFMALRLRVLPASIPRAAPPLLGAAWLICLTTAAYRHGEVVGRPWPWPPHDPWTLVMGGAATIILVGIAGRSLRPPARPSSVGEEAGVPHQTSGPARPAVRTPRPTRARDRT